MNDEYLKRRDLEFLLSDVANLVNTGVFQCEVLAVFRKSVFTELMINLNDLLQKLSILGRRIDFVDDVAGNGVTDLTDLVSKMRNAACHVDSGNKVIPASSVKLSFCVAIGKGSLIAMDGRTITSDYSDDICFLFGEYKLYLKRHILRSIDEAKKTIIDLFPDDTRTE